MIRKILAAGAACMVGAGLAAANAEAAPGGSACTVDGDVTFKQPLNSVAKDFAYTFSGLITCESTIEDSPAIMSAGENVTIGGVVYRPLSTPLGNGTCNHNNSTGEILIQWGTGKLSVLPYQTAGSWFEGGYGTLRSGSITLTRATQDPNNPQHTTDTFALSYGGYYHDAALALVPAPADASKCTTDGVTSGTIQGFAGFGNYQ